MIQIPTVKPGMRLMQIPPINPVVPLMLFFLWLLLLLAPLQASSQTELRRMAINQVSPPSAGIPVFTEHPDKAAIIISSSLTNLVFTSNMDGIVDQRNDPSGGRYILIVEPYTQIIQAAASGFMTGRFRIGAPRAREVMYFEIEPEERTPGLIPLVFNVRPEDARVFVDGQIVEANRTILLPPGVKQVRLEREGYRVIEDVITVSLENVLFSYGMEELDIVPVRIRANVPGARVVIDGTERGDTDPSGGFDLFLYPGAYALSVSHTGYITRNLTLVVTDEGVNLAEVELIRNIGELLMQTDPPGAQVLLNREDYTGQTILELAPGRYRLDVEMEGYDPHSETIDIILNEQLQKTIRLTPHTGSLQFTVTPTHASAKLLDGTGRMVQQWEGLNLLRGLRTGPYTLRVEAPGYRAVERTIRISRGEMLEQRIELAEMVSFQCGDAIADIDGNTYRTVQIGEQCWMAENLKTSRYRNGPAIPNIRDNGLWAGLSSGAWAHFDNDPGNNDVFGKLYNWHAVADSRGLCPDGWRVPTEDDWERLIGFVSVTPAGGKLKAAGTQHWRAPNAGATNETGFTGLPGGTRSGDGGFYAKVSLGSWWSSTGSGTTNYAWAMSLNDYSPDAEMSYLSGQNGMYVRCLME